MSGKIFLADSSDGNSGNLNFGDKYTISTYDNNGDKIFMIYDKLYGGNLELFTASPGSTYSKQGWMTIYNGENG